MVRSVDKVSVIGGGGVRVPLLLHGLLRRSRELSLQEIVLTDTVPERAQLMAELGTALGRSLDAETRIRVSGDLDDVFDGVGFVFSAVRTGGAEARIRDERIALRHGLIGQETTGIGGMSMALRTIPVVLDLIERMRRRAPSAWFLNFTNPSGLIVEALHQAGHERVVGLCDAPSGLKADICRYLGVAEDDVSIAYQGLNHLGWIQSVRIEGVETLPGLLEGAADLCSGVRTLGFFGPELIQGLGLLPNEYLYYFYRRRAAYERELSLERTRGEMILAWNERLYAEVGAALRQGDAASALERYRAILAARRNSYMTEVTESRHDRGITAETIFTEEGYEGLALRVMTALGGRGDEELHLNVPSRGTSDILAPDEVGELTCDVDLHGAHPRLALPLPLGPRGLVRQVKDYERLTVRAAIHGDRESALQAAMAHPLIGDRAVASACLDELLAAHRDLLPQFA